MPWFPNLGGESHALQDAVRRLYQHVYDLQARQSAAQPAADTAHGEGHSTSLQHQAQRSVALTGYDVLAAGSSTFLRTGQASILPVAVRSMTWSATTTSITITWSSVVLYWPDGTQQSIADGSVQVNGLTNGTVYDFYPYYDIGARSVVFVGASEPKGVGSPSYAFTATSLPAYQQQNADGHVPLSKGACQATCGGAGGSFGGIGS